VSYITKLKSPVLQPLASVEAVEAFLQPERHGERGGEGS
jgi:hypothetical protein